MNILFAKNGSPPLRGGTQTQQQQQQNPNQQNQQNQPATSAQPDFDLEQVTKEEGYFPWLGGQPDNTRPGSDGKSTTRPVSDLVGRVRVVPDQRSNSLLISANVHFFPEVMKLIEELDVPTPQVMIEARIVEVSTDYLEALGVRWSPNGAQEFSGTDFDNSFMASGAGNYVKGFGGLTTIGGTNALTSALTSVRSGVLSASMNMDVLIQFLKEKTAATVLDQPQMNIADNETGRLFVGQSVPIIQNSSAPPVGGVTQSFQYRDVGVKLEVTPHINITGDVSLKIHVESSAVVPGETILGGVVINSRNFKTDLTSRNGQTLVLGGIIQKQLSDTSRKTPGLGSIPGLKWLFNKKDKTSNEVELMVFLRPKVVRSPEEAKELLEETDKKAPLVKQWQDDSQPKDTGKKSK
jgi:general secretion pathway protein D